jgi:replicative DNA helicase
MGIGGIMYQEYQTKLEEIQKIDVQNERTAIGHMLQDEQASLSGSRMLQPKYFLTPYAAHIFKIIQSCIDKAQSVSEIHFKISSIADEDWKALAPELNIERRDYVSSCLIQAIPFLGTDVIAEGVFNKIQEQYLRRIMCLEYQKAVSGVLNTSNTKDLKEVVGGINQKSNDILDGMIASVEHDYKSKMLSILNQKDVASISTGFKALDEIIEGFKPGQLITVGAGTGVGKSAFAVNLALNITAQGYKVGLWSFEMSEREVGQRIISAMTCITKKDNARQEERYNAARKYIDNTSDDIQIFTDRIRDLSSFYLQCRRLSIRENMKVVIIDYLQLIHLSNEARGNRVAEIEYLTTNFKNIASELGITIIILSQLSRDHKRREDKTPMLSDLRDSGSIEQDSNIVIFLHKPDEQPSDLNKSEKLIQIIVAKHREGRMGTFFMKYQGDITKFIETTGGF